MADPISKGSLVSHVVLWVVVIIIGAWLVWSATHSSTENNKYASGASSTDVKHDGFRLVDQIELFNLSCVPRDTLKPKAKVVKK